jgi:propionate CoA-transferase
MDSQLRIGEGTQHPKLVEAVEHVTFSGPRAARLGQPVTYITERAVFRLGERGLELTEIAPGVDLERDVLAHMGFEPVIDGSPALMDERIFGDAPLGLERELTDVPLSSRLTYDSAQNLLFINFEGLTVRDREDVAAIRREVESRVAPLGHRVNAVVNYDNFSIRPELVDVYADMVRYLVDRYYDGITRYTTSAFLRLKLGESLGERGLAPHIFESREEAQRHLKTS